MTSVSRLFDPISIGTMEVKNRIAMAPMATDYAESDGSISQRLIDYLAARAAGGVGLITSEMTTIDEFSPYVPRTVALWDDKFIPGFKRLSEAVHAHGAKIIPQIAHPGPESLSPFIHEKQPVGPSPVMCFVTKQISRELDADEIETIIEQFGEAARRAREGGCDGMELHAAHSYMLVGSFLSALRNKRADEYGGDLDGRLRMPLRVIERVRQKAGADFPIVLRMSGDYVMEGGGGIDEARYVASTLEQAGVAAFHVSAGMYPDYASRIMPPTGTPLRPNAGLARAIKEVVDVPVMVVGRINEPRVAEEVLARGDADMVVMGRALLADPAFPEKARSGRFEDIAPCTGCGIGCVAGRLEGRDMTCVINPWSGREGETELLPAANPRKVMVVGAGPAGMEAARVAAQRGHRVTLFDKAPKTGGLFNLAAVPPHKQELTRVTKYLTTQLAKAGVEVRLNTEVTEAVVDAERPDVAIIATGGEPIVPEIPGIEGRRITTYREVLAGRIPIMPGKVLIIGGGMAGCETAEFMFQQGDSPLVGHTSVTIVEMRDAVATDMSPEGRVVLMERMRRKGIEIMLRAKVVKFLEDGVVVEQDGEETAIRGAERIVLCMGSRPVDELSHQIAAKVDEVHVIGDAKEARRLCEAIREGREAAMAI
jgi:2,4-dienoyl-CoA reductase-like NADH-dependent reductase (Old Yellow Enzyme family)/thioredoxin reductase